MSNPYVPPPIVDEAIKRWDEARNGHHAEFVRRYERNERSYRGILDVASDAARWRHKLHPPYAFNLIETIVSNTVEMGLRMSVRPSPQVNVPLEEAMTMLDRAESIGDLLRHEHRIDEMDYKQRPIFLTASLCGRGISKSYWNLSEGTVKRQGTKMVPIYDDDGNVQLEVPTVQEITEHGIVRDHSTTEVVDPRDFVLHESARALQPWEHGGAQHLFHRCWYSKEQLKMWEAAGFVQNVDMLGDTLSFAAEYQDREQELWNVNRTKDLIEVLEYWCMKNGTVKRTIIGNRVILLRDEEDCPFWHGGYPFQIYSSMPMPFSTVGMSDIELIHELQLVLWELMNQRLDNLELINNFITLIRSDVDDPDAYEFYPGARWPTDDPKSVQVLQPPYQLSEATLRAEALLKGDLQNVTSAAPFASGAETATVDQKTATGASIVMNAAQQRLVAKKYQAQQGLRQEAWMRIKNCQQFISDKKLVHVVGPDGAMRFREMSALDIQGEFAVELEPMGESQMRQERRAESMQFGQVMMQWAPTAAAAGVPINVKEVIKWTAKRWDIDDSERFFSQNPASLGAMGAGGPGGGATGPPGEAEVPGQPNLGITAASAVDASSPSATGGASLSPAMHMARALSMGGGPNNV